MPKVRFETGQVVNFDSMPSQSDIDEVASKLGINKQSTPKESSVSRFVENVKEHPFRSAFTPVNVTAGQKPGREVYLDALSKILNPESKIDRFLAPLKAFEYGVAGDVSDLLKTPSTYFGLPGLGVAGRAIGKIPIAGTTAGAIAKTTPVGKGFVEGVKELGKYEQHLKTLMPTSARAPIKATFNPFEAFQPKPITEKDIDEKILSSFNQAVRPSVQGKSGQAYQLDKFKNDVVLGVKSIVGNKDKIQLGEETGKVPENLDDFLEAILQRKKDVWTQRVEISNGVDEMVDIGDIYKKSLLPLKQSLYVKVNNPAFAKSIDDVIVSATEQGKIPITVAHNLLTDINKSLAPFYKNPNLIPDNVKLIEANVAKTLRNELDDIIAGKFGKSYGDLGKEYGALRALEKEVLPRIVVKGRQAPKGFFDISDVWSYGDILSGTLSGNPAQVTRGLAMAGVKNWIKSKNDANNIIRSMFKEIDIPSMYPKKVPITPELLTGLGTPAKQKQLIGYTPKYLQERGNIPEKPFTPHKPIEPSVYTSEKPLKTVMSEEASQYLNPEDARRYLESRKTRYKQQGLVPPGAFGGSAAKRLSGQGGFASTGDDLLRAEARKYKTPEEFVEAQPKVYHGTKYQFQDFDPAHLGKLTKAESAKNAFFFTSKKEISEGYANLGDMPQVEALQAEVQRLEKIAQKSRNNIDWRKHQKALEKYENAALGEENKAFVGEVKEVTLDLKNPMVVDKQGFSYNEKELANWVKEAKQKGHDGLIIKNAADSVDTPIVSKERRPDREISDVYAVFEPSQIQTKSQLTALWHEVQNGDKSLGIVGPMAMASAGIAGGAMAGNAQAAQQPQKVDMDRIYQIESSGNAKAFNEKSQARGLGQITPIALKEWNNYHPNLQFSKEDLFNENKNKLVADWYMNKLIEKYLKSYKIPVNSLNKIATYNWGMGDVKKWHNGGGKFDDLPKETKDYYNKYIALQEMR